MTESDIWQTLQSIRNTLIQAHVQMNHAMDQVEKLAEEVRKDAVQEAETK